MCAARENWFHHKVAAQAYVANVDHRYNHIFGELL